jgi:hypothetical protein
MRPYSKSGVRKVFFPLLPVPSNHEGQMTNNKLFPVPYFMIEIDDEFLRGAIIFQLA